MGEKVCTIGALLPLLRYKAFDRRDEGGKVILAPECEEFTHAVFNVNSGFLDLLNNVQVDTIDSVDDTTRLWIATDGFDEPCTEKPAVDIVRCGECFYLSDYTNIEGLRRCDKWASWQEKGNRVCMPEDGFCSYGQRKGAEE